MFEHGDFRTEVHNKQSGVYVFRPIRTDRERWVDSCVELFIDHYGNPKGGEQYIGIAERLYDAMQSGKLPKPEGL